MRTGLEKFMVKSTDSIRLAMVKITSNKHRAVVVLDGSKVVGTVTDGDIRRAFLQDVLAIAPVEKIMNINCHRTIERDPKRQAAILRKQRITLLPIVNQKNDLLDIVLAYEPFPRSAAR